MSREIDSLEWNTSTEQHTDDIDAPAGIGDFSVERSSAYRRFIASRAAVALTALTAVVGAAVYASHGSDPIAQGVATETIYKDGTEAPVTEPGAGGQPGPAEIGSTCLKPSTGIIVYGASDQFGYCTK